MPPFGLLMPGSLNGEPGAVRGVTRRVGLEVLAGLARRPRRARRVVGPGGSGETQPERQHSRRHDQASTHHDPLHPVTRPAAGLDHCRRQATPTIVWQRCPQRQNDPTIRRHSRLDPPPSDPSSGGSSLPILRLGGVCGVGKTVGRGPVRGGGAGHGGRPDVSADENAPPKSRAAGRLSCRAWLRLIWWWFVVAADGIVWVTAGRTRCHSARTTALPLVPRNRGRPRQPLRRVFLAVGPSDGR